MKVMEHRNYKEDIKKRDIYISPDKELVICTRCGVIVLSKQETKFVKYRFDKEKEE